MLSFDRIVFAPLGVCLRIAAILLVLGQITLLILALRQRRGAKTVTLSWLHVLLGLIFLTMLLDGAYRVDYLPYVRGYLPFVRAFYGCPWLLIAGAELSDAAVLGMIRFSRAHPTAQTIKQAVDLLPTGVCISQPSGTVLLSNLHMNRWNRSLTGGTLSDANALRRTVRERGQAQDGKWLVHLEDGTALLFQDGTLSLDGAEYLQLAAEDVTELFRATRELEEKNARLRELQYRMKAFKVRETDLLMREELLSARTTVHNQLGGALLTGKYHLEHPETTDPETLRLMLLQINTYLLSEVEDPEPRADSFESSLKLASGIGITVEITGQVPRKGKLRDLLGQAVGECAANTVKHAGGDRLEVTVQDSGFTVTNNGKEAIPSVEVSDISGCGTGRRRDEAAEPAVLCVDGHAALLIRQKYAAPDGPKPSGAANHFRRFAVWLRISGSRVHSASA